MLCTNDLIYTYSKIIITNTNNNKHLYSACSTECAHRLFTVNYFHPWFIGLETIIYHHSPSAEHTSPAAYIWRWWSYSTIQYPSLPDQVAHVSKVACLRPQEQQSAGLKPQPFVWQSSILLLDYWSPKMSSGWQWRPLPTRLQMTVQWCKWKFVPAHRLPKNVSIVLFNIIPKRSHRQSENALSFQWTITQSLH